MHASLAKRLHDAGEAFIRSPQHKVRRIHALTGKQFLLPEGYAEEEDAVAVESIAVPMLLFSAKHDA